MKEQNGDPYFWGWGDGGVRDWSFSIWVRIMVRVRVSIVLINVIFDTYSSHAQIKIKSILHQEKLMMRLA